jgi:hypothetical protein
MSICKYFPHTAQWLCVLSFLLVSNVVRADQVAYSTNTAADVFMPWNSALQVPKFNQPFTRLDGVMYSITGTATASVSIQNNAPTNNLVTLRGTNVISVNRPSGGPLASMNFSNTAAAIVLAHDNKIISSTENANVSGTLPLNEIPAYIGTGTVSFAASAGAGDIIVTAGSSFIINKAYQGSAGLTLTYSFTPIGLTQQDPIFPNSLTASNSVFTGAPSGRWFGSAPTPTIQFEMKTPGAAFTQILSAPTNYGSIFNVTTNGLNFSEFAAGQSFAFNGAGVQSFILVGLNSGFPIRLGFNQTNASFTMTPIVIQPSIVSIGISNSMVKVSWSSFTGGFYQAQYKSTVNGTNWISIGNKITATGNTSSFEEAKTNVFSRFYRIALVP